VDEQRCPQAEDLRAFALGRLPDDAVGPLADHLDRCPACQRAAEVLDWADDEMTAALRGPMPSEPYLDEPECRVLLARAESLTAPAPLSAIRLGPYRLDSRLGADAMGSVYAGVNEQTGATVTVKVLSARRLTDPERIARTLHEVLRAGQLDHPNLARTTEAGEDGGELYLVTETVAGLEAGALVRRSGPLPVREACEVARQAALGLAHAHRCGLTHGDLQPSNLLLTPDGVKVFDLGLTPALTDTTAGSADHVHAAQARLDLYNLGYVLYHLLTGRPPRGLWQLDVPGAPVELIYRMVATDPPGLPLTADTVAEKLAPFAVGADLAALLNATPPSPPATQEAHGFAQSMAAATQRAWAAIASLWYTTPRDPNDTNCQSV